MTQTKLLFGSLLLRKHVNSRQFIAPILNPSWGSNPKPTAQTVHSYLAGRFLNGYPFRSEKGMLRHNAQHQVETIKMTKISYHLDQDGMNHQYSPCSLYFERIHSHFPRNTFMILLNSKYLQLHLRFWIILKVRLSQNEFVKSSIFQNSN